MNNNSARKVTLIRNLVTEEVYLNHNAHTLLYQEYPSQHSQLAYMERADCFIENAPNIHTKFVPITAFSQEYGNPNLYIAYTPEVEKLFKIPINELITQNRYLTEENYQLRVRIERDQDKIRECNISVKK